MKLTIEQAIELLEGEEIHTIVNPSNGMTIGASWERQDLIDAITEAGGASIGGDGCRAIGHGLVLEHDIGSSLFIEVDDAALSALEGPVMDKAAAGDELIPDACQFEVMPRRQILAYIKRCIEFFGINGVNCAVDAPFGEARATLEVSDAIVGLSVEEHADHLIEVTIEVLRSGEHESGRRFNFSQVGADKVEPQFAEAPTS